MRIDYISAVVFDAVGTVLHPDPSAIEVYQAFGRQFGSRLTGHEIAVRFKSALLREDERDRLSGWRTDENREESRWRTIVAATLNDVPNTEECFQRLFDHFADPDAWRCDPALVAFLAGAIGMGLRIGIASNFDCRLHCIVRTRRELARVQFTVVSSEVGWRKPAKEFFASVVQAAGCPAGNVLYVGDDPENDGRAAGDAGLQSMLVNDFISLAPSFVRRP